MVLTPENAKFEERLAHNRKILAQRKSEQNKIPEPKDPSQIRREEGLRYARSRNASIGRSISRGFRFIKSPTKTLYEKEPLYYPGFSPTSKKGYGKRGRPAGTKDPRYAAYGGVYGWRKAQAQQRALQRIRAQSGAGLNPEEQALLARIRAQEMAKRANPEAAIIPDTSGKIPMESFTAEIDRAAGLVD